MTQLAGKLHEAESVISAWNKQPEPPAAEEVLRHLYALRMPEWLEDEQRVLRSVLGENHRLLPRREYYYDQRLRPAQHGVRRPRERREALTVTVIAY